MMTSRIIGCYVMVALVTAYPEGPPVDVHPEICEHMSPTGHNTTAKTTAPPFEIVFDATCYKSGMDIPVTVRIKDSEDTYFEGLFVMARKSANMDEHDAYGTFNVGSDGELQTLDCFGDTASAMGQSSKAHYTTKSFTWKPPADETDDMKFQGTIVHETEDYWEEVRSAAISYDADCGASGDGGSAAVMAGYTLVLLTTICTITLI